MDLKTRIPRMRIRSAQYQPSKDAKIEIFQHIALTPRQNVTIRQFRLDDRGSASLVTAWSAMKQGILSNLDLEAIYP
jgi:hypothetical protein